MAKPRNPRDRVESQLTRVVADMERLEGVKTKADADLAELETKRAELAAQLAELGEKRIKVSDHAAVRYLERMRGLDRPALDAEIITDELQGLVDRLGGTGKFPLKDSGFGVVMRDYTIVTVTTPGKDQ